MVASESALANKVMFKVSDKKESTTISVNVNRVSLSVTWNIFLKSAAEFAFSKTSCLSSKQYRQQVYVGLLQGSEHTLTQFKN